MRRIRHLDHCDYIMQINPQGSQPLLASGSSNILIERTWHRDDEKNLSITAHAKFNVDAMNGIQISAFVDNGGRILNSASGSIALYRIAEAGWTETLIGTFATTLTGRLHTLYVNQATLGSSNELSGMETYAAQIAITRRHSRIRKKFYFNHIGCFDSIVGLRKEIERIQVTKATR